MCARPGARGAARAQDSVGASVSVTERKMEAPTHVLATVAAAGTVAMCAHCALARKDQESMRKAAIAAVVGGLTADAAAVTSHWMYDQTELAEKVAELGGEQSAPFIDPPLNKYYHVKAGQQSCCASPGSRTSPPRVAEIMPLDTGSVQ